MKHDVIRAGNPEQDLTIVALHGIQGTRSSWLPVERNLHDDARWILPNLRGRAAAWRGASIDDYSLDAYAAEVCAIIAQYVDTPNFVLAGWSMGVSVTLATWAQLKQGNLPLPKALILMSGSPVLQQVRWFRQTNHTSLIEEIAAREERLRLQVAADRDAVAWTWRSISQTDQRHLLPHIQLPTLIVHGSDDEDSPFSHAQMLAAGIRGARLECIPHGYHSILTQDAPQVAKTMRAFLSTLPQTGALHATQ
ncbi:MAG: alpha/beta hydrolase [Oxalicibacterium faecigallinarum]|uniref:AB hydrolase-1 domain-containing protein n=1 Tax=Oxalicibacterium faecigallinarum TaxID=573741 RepID=A0A8J3AWK5_9BURK|nr:alpha/beta hydrolase [Oxalicibacterium faecigallinarum]MDQ7970392.1 alpha/beta hydrolase [Oxalicibacterium faecigallinarum]GGI20946.1 hypothetical protein GCM10008066_26550 [Oxalicibacterium faecigallinarum]